MKLQRSSVANFGMTLLVPIVDVAAALLFFFLLSGSFLLQPGIAVDVPKSPFILAPQRDPRIVSITGDPAPAVYFDNQRVTTGTLRERLNRIELRGGTIIIKADRRAPVELLIAVVNLSIEEGFAVVIATAEPSGSEK